MKSSIKFIGLNTLTILNPVELAKAYQTIYGAKPWSEYKKCSNPNCTAHWGVEDAIDLEKINYTHCDSLVADYWSDEHLFKMFQDISEKPYFSAAIAFDTNMRKMVGFCWGYEIPMGKIDSFLVLTGTADLLLNLPAPAIYLADLAVDSNYRGKGIARELAKQRAEMATQSGIQTVYTRTKGHPEPSVTHVWYDKINFPIIHEYHDERHRVIRAQELEKIYW